MRGRPGWLPILNFREDGFSVLIGRAMGTNDELLRIWVDFNTLSLPPFDRVLIPTHAQPDLLPLMREGARVLLIENAPSDSMEVEGVLRFDDQLGRWFGVPDWSTLRYV